METHSFPRDASETAGILNIQRPTSSIQHSMAHARRRGLVFTAMVACALLHAHGWATGGFEEEPLQTLSDYLWLDQLPAKSAGCRVTRYRAGSKESPTVLLRGLQVEPAPVNCCT